MRTIALLLALAALAAAGCGDDDSGSNAASGDAAMEKKDDAAMEKKDEEAMEKKDEEAMEKKEEEAMEKEDAAMKKAGATITLQDSNFGPMLFDKNKQAIYVFERDGRDKTVCYGECAAAWPPVFTKGKPRAGDGVNASLLGTIMRRDGRTQVTYAGKPLYFYAHEDPGVVLCHNVNLNGGLWWAVGADGKPRPA
jgi:predicted lipoprotein with Yx(FWY)xxD motif